MCRKDKHKVVFEKGHGICEKHRQGCIISVMVYFRGKTGEKEVTDRRGGGQEGKKRKEQEREKRCVKGGEKWRLGGGEQERKGWEEGGEKKWGVLKQKWCNGHETCNLGWWAWDWWIHFIILCVYV